MNETVNLNFKVEFPEEHRTVLKPSQLHVGQLICSSSLTLLKKKKKTTNAFCFLLVTCWNQSGFLSFLLLLLPRLLKKTNGRFGNENGGRHALAWLFSGVFSQPGSHIWAAQPSEPLFTKSKSCVVSHWAMGWPACPALKEREFHSTCHGGLTPPWANVFRSRVLWVSILWQFARSF